LVKIRFRTGIEFIENFRKLMILKVFYDLTDNPYIY
jgi:hypothetical protein